MGDKWILLILREAFYGVTKFEDFRKNILIPKQTLSNRLSDLVEHGIFEHSVYKAEGKREHKEYLLTQKGKSLIGLFNHEGNLVTLDNIRLEIENPKSE